MHARVVRAPCVGRCYSTNTSGVAPEVALTVGLPRLLCLLCQAPFHRGKGVFRGGAAGACCQLCLIGTQLLVVYVPYARCTPTLCGVCLLVCGWAGVCVHTWQHASASGCSGRRSSSHSSVCSSRAEVGLLLSTTCSKRVL